MADHKVSQRRASELVGMSRSQLSYQSQKKEDTDLVADVLAIKERHPYYGVPRVLCDLRRKGYIVNGKRVARLLKTLDLLVTRRNKKKKSYIYPSKKMPIEGVINEVWSMDFITHKLVDGKPFRCLTIIDNLSREVPAIFASESMAGFKTVDVLEKLKATTKLPSHFIIDNGPEFTSWPFIKWCEQNGISLHFIDPGKPVQNAYIESFNGKFRLEFLQQHTFKSIQQVRSRLENWLIYYNKERPHSALDYETPKAFGDRERTVLDRKINLLVLKTG